jgi:hypothetical protein
MARVDEGLQTLREVLSLVQTQALHFWEAELYRLQGELRLIQAAGRAGRAPSGQTRRRRAVFGTPSPSLAVSKPSP